MTIILILCGKSGSGKTTLINYIKTQIPQRVVLLTLGSDQPEPECQKDSVQLTIAEPLKKACKEIFLLSDKQLYDQKMKEQIDPRWGVSPRVLFQRIGDLFRDHLDKVLPELRLRQSTIFIDNLCLRIDTILLSDPPIIIIEDGRLPDEISVLKKKYNAISIKLNRDNISGVSILRNDHQTESVEFKTDFEIDNSGTLNDLYKKYNTILYGMY